MNDDRGRDRSSDDRSIIDHSSDDRSTIDYSSDDRSAIDRELRHALAVEPSPAFKARVRERIVREAAPSPWGLRWIVGPAALSAAALVVLLAVLVVSIYRWGPDGALPAGGDVREPLATTSIPVPDQPVRAGGGPWARDQGGVTRPQTALVAKSRRPEPASPESGTLALGGSRGQTREFEVLISPGESEALRRLITDVRSGRVDPTSWLRLREADVLIELPMEIVVRPVEITLIQVQMIQTAGEFQ